MPRQRSFRGEIRVATRIVDDLSSGLYNNPAACLKELVNNSYDADAREVNIFVKPDADSIVVEDDGVGLTRDEFERHFARISDSQKREVTDVTSSGRPKIGKIGIGFIAANELCNYMEIASTVAGSNELLRVQINFEKMRMSVEDRRRRGDDFAKGDYVGHIEEAEKKAHYTRIFLNEIRGEAQEVLAGAQRAGVPGHAPTLYGRQPQSVVKILGKQRSWTDLDLYSQTMTGVALNVPVQYLPGWIPAKAENDLGGFANDARDLDFRVWYDGGELRKPVLLGHDGSPCVWESFELEGESVGARGYLFAQHGTIRPQELNGVLLRIRNAAVGEYDSSFLGFPTSHGTLFQRWISAEVWADDRLEEAMNIDRRTLRTTSPAFVELQSRFHERLQSFLSVVRSELYLKRRNRRETEEAALELSRVDEILHEPELALADGVIKDLRDAFNAALRGAQAGRFARRRMSPSEVLELGLEVGRETLDARTFNAYARALARRLTE